MSVEQVEIIIPSSDADKKKLKDAIIEADGCLIRIDAEKDQVKTILENLAEEFQIDKKTLRKTLSIYHKQNKHKVDSEKDNVDQLYDALF